MNSISVIIPAKNEEMSIGRLLDSLVQQTMPPKEIIIVDGGSNDRTIDIIDSYIQKGYPIKLIRTTNSLPGRARNLAIQASSTDLIAAIDAGCFADLQWLANLLNTFKLSKTTDVVFGRYLPFAQSLLEKCFVACSVPDDTTLSVVSILFKKNVWMSVGGFPENLRTGEDGVFIKRIEEGRFNICFNDNAIVYWFPRTSLFAFAGQFYLYAKGQAEVNVNQFFYIRKIVFYVVLFILLIMGFSTHVYALIYLGVIIFLMWIFLSLRQHKGWLKKLGTDIRAFLLLPLVILFRDSGSIIGFFIGWCGKNFKNARSICQ